MERRIDGVTAIAPVNPVNPKRVNPKEQKRDPRKKRPWDDMFREHLFRDRGEQGFQDGDDALRKTSPEKKQEGGAIAWNPAWGNTCVFDESDGNAPAGQHVDTTA